MHSSAKPRRSWNDGFTPVEVKRHAGIDTVEHLVVPNLSGSVDVRAVINAYDVDDPFHLIDAEDHPVSAAACGVIAAQFAGKRLADPMRVIQEWSGQELGDRCRDGQRQAARWPFNEDATS